MAPVLPLDLNCALRGQSWQKTFRWPLEHALVRDFHVELEPAFLQLLSAEQDPFWRDVLLLAAPALWMEGLSSLEYALLLQSAQLHDMAPAGGPSKAFFLDGRKVPEGHEATIPPILHARPLRHAMLRRLARVASWTRWHDLPRAVVKPQAVAITHNSLLVAEARRRRACVGYNHAATILAESPDVISEKIDAGQIALLLEKTAAIFAGHTALEGPYQERLLKLFIQEMSEPLKHAALMMRKLRRAGHLPAEIWSATGGSTVSRAIRIECLRRGRAVTGFEHGGALGMVDEPFGFALTELAVSKNYVVVSRGVAENLGASAQKLAKRFTDADISFGHGDPAFRVPLHTMRPSGNRKRVLYVSGPFIGPCQRMRPAQHDVMKMDWQIHLAQTLKSLPIELLCQPHPEGALTGRPHPLERIAATSGRNFEEVLDWADVVVTDMVMSTTVWVAACSNKPVVLVDLDMCNFNPRFMPLLRGRFRIVRASYENRNLPRIERDELGEAIVESFLYVDPLPFRALLAGESGDTTSDSGSRPLA